jgi:hypothetical protein
LKQQDVLSATTGASILTLAGSVRVNFTSGAVIDITSGSATSSGSVLTTAHRYLVAENTTANFTVTSKTAVIDTQGTYSQTLSNAINYNAMATALKNMHLFRGSLTGFGSGYDLEYTPTRLQAIIMFIRVLGEEDEALAYSGSVPFSDIAKGSDAEKYIGYAYSRGYTTGYTKTLFKPSISINAYQYTEFMLRALGYSSNSNTDLSATLNRAQTWGVLTAGEAAALKRETFLRAQLVYISYYALNSTIAGSSSTLRDTLIQKGVFTAAESKAASALVTSSRIG